jgi:hypothetical protein
MCKERLGKMSTNVIATIHKEEGADPKTGNCIFYPSLTLVSEDGTDCGTIYFREFDELARVLQKEAGVTREVLEDRFFRYDIGEQVEIHMPLDNDQIARIGFSPCAQAA